jgi:Zn-dependent alcohol dehydrogenase
VVSVDSLVKIEPHIPLTPAALLSCAIPTGYGSAAYRANVRGGDTVVVIGAGGIGTAAIQGARINGAAQLVAVDPVEFKQRPHWDSVPLTVWRRPPRPPNWCAS